MGFLKKTFGGALKFVGNIVGKILKPIGKLLKKWLSPKIPDKEGLKIQRKGSDIFIPVVYGTREVGGIVVDSNVTDASGGADNEFYHVLAVFCHGEIDGYVDILFNGISYTDKRWLKDKNNPSGAKWYTIQTRTGAAGQTAVNATGKLNRFNAATSLYEGLAYVFVTFQQDKDQAIWNGEPEITAVIRGKKCYDPRTLTTAYTENPAIHLLDYVKSTLYADGLTDNELVLSSFITVANICDTEEVATVDTQVCQTVNGVYTCTGNPAQVVSFKRFSQNTIIDTENTVFNNMQEIANSFRGFFPDSNGLLKIACEKEETSVFSFNSDNILSDITSTEPGKSDRYNQVIVRFPNIANKYEKDEVAYPENDNPLYQQWLDEDNGLPNQLIINAEYCVYKALALQLAEVAVKVSRNSATVTFTADATANELDIGDVFDITEETRGWVNKLFRISDIEYRNDGFVNITGIQHEDAAYPWSNIDYSEIIGGSNLGDPTDLPAPTGLTITADPTFSTAGRLTWNIENNAFIRRFEVSVFQDTTLVYRAEPLAQLWSIPLLAPNSYSIQVRAVSTIGTLSPPASIAFNLVQPVAPTDINFTVGNFEVEARPVLLGAGLGTVFEFAIGDTSIVRGRGISLVFTGLSHSTEYTVFARTVNALGVSGWFSKNIITTANSAQITDLIGQDVAATVFDDVVAAVNANLEITVDNALVDYPNNTEVQQLIDNSISLVNEADAEDTRIEVVNDILSVLDEYDNRVEIKRVDFTIAQEAGVRAAAIVELNAADQALIQQVQTVETNLNGNSSAISVLQGQVNNPTTGLSASFNLAQTANTNSNNNATTISQIQNQINDPLTGLTANASFIQQVDLKADQATTAANSAQNTANNALSSATAITNTVNNPTTGLSATNTLAQQAKTTSDGNASAITAINGAINNPTTGLSATYTLAQSAKTTADGNATSISTINGKVDNPTTGLTASYNLAQQAKITADGNASSITTINNTINNPTNGLSAAFTLATTANNTANTANNTSNSNATAIANLSTQVTNIDGDLSQAEITLQSTVNELGVVSSRAFLGVTNVVGGAATINGIVVNGATNTLEFRTNTFRWTDVAGNVQAYWDAGRGKVVWLGDLVAGTFQTATSGYRAEMSGSGSYPFWYGTGEKTLANALFAVDNVGVVTMRNATVQGKIVTSEGTGIRVDVGNDGTYLIWAGSGSKTDVNGVFWIKTNGTGFVKGEFFQGQIIESKIGSISNGISIPATATAPAHSSAGKPVEVDGKVSVTFRTNGNTASQSSLFTLTLKRDGVNLTVVPFTATGFYEAEDVQTLYTGFIQTAVVDTLTTVNNRSYSATLTRTGGVVPSSNVLVNMTVKTYENKLG